MLAGFLFGTERGGSEKNSRTVYNVQCTKHKDFLHKKILSPKSVESFLCQFWKQFCPFSKFPNLGLFSTLKNCQHGFLQIIFKMILKFLGPICRLLPVWMDTAALSQGHNTATLLKERRIRKARVHHEEAEFVNNVWCLYICFQAFFEGRQWQILLGMETNIWGFGQWKLDGEQMLPTCSVFWPDECV